jgi:hypothetical protein
MTRSTRLYLAIGFLGSLIFTVSPGLQAQPGNPFPPDCKFPAQPPAMFVVSQLVPPPPAIPGGKSIPPKFDDPLPVPLPAVPAPSTSTTLKPLPDIVPPRAKKPLPLPAEASPVPPTTLVAPLPRPIPSQPRDSALHDETRGGNYSVPAKLYPSVPEPKPEIKNTGFTNNAAAGVAPLPPDPFSFPLPTKPSNNPDPLAPGGLIPVASPPVAPPIKMTPTIVATPDPIAPAVPPEVKNGPLPAGSSPWVVRVEIIDSMTHLIARGKNTEFRVVCENLKMQSPSGDIAAEGDITIAVAGLNFSCDRLILNWQDEWVMMDGNVRFSTEKDGQRADFHGAELRLRLSTLAAASASNDPGAFLLKTSFFRPAEATEQPAPRALYQSPLHKGTR